jgi:hypothetical protein
LPKKNLIVLFDVTHVKIPTCFKVRKKEGSREIFVASDKKF